MNIKLLFDKLIYGESYSYLSSDDANYLLKESKKRIEKELEKEIKKIDKELQDVYIMIMNLAENGEDVLKLEKKDRELTSHEILRLENLGYFITEYPSYIYMRW